MARNAKDSDGRLGKLRLNVNRISIASGTIFVALLVLATSHPELEQYVDTAFAMAPASFPPAATNSHAHQGFLYGRITTEDGDVYEGRLRWGGNEEAFWGEYFNGFKDENPWSVHVSPDRLKKKRAIKIFGVEIAQWESDVNLGRPFMGRFGDIARIEGGLARFG